MSGGQDVVRTPEEALQGLPDFPFESRYHEVDGLRLAYLDEGEGRRSSSSTASRPGRTSGAR